VKGHGIQSNAASIELDKFQFEIRVSSVLRRATGNIEIRLQRTPTQLKSCDNSVKSEVRQ